MTDFMAYLRRRDRVAALEHVLDAAKALTASIANSSGDEAKMLAYLRLRDAIAAADRLPAPNSKELASKK